MGRTRLGRLVTATTAVLALSAGGSLFAAAPAFAGSNGQQIYVSWGPAWGRATIDGFNQDGQYVHSPSIQLGGTGYGSLSGWWWKGEVEIAYYNLDGTSRDYWKCQVPENQGGSDWYGC
ncbi:hypothetical protein O7602_26540 [Micromonospora sp. WMMD1128]|uniref:hypothetical protein n=1 Tax=Micromonospora sp. WMMD1128 TaxID=3015150 RepID=UPI00248D38A1|nr:hypothetical protein [Micromonospora sp. WMMD1128]WBB73203.1 hypothetical protein O7602_26540 [Micromonospora sp. WMMD1128]